MKQKYINYFLIASVLMFASCTDLEVEEFDSLVIETESGEFGGINPVTGLATGYENLRGFGDQANLYALLEVTTDELLVPTRGTDWGDNGVWRTLHQHNWDAAHDFVLNTWNNLNSNVFRLNQLLAPVSNANASQLAEGKFLRAYNMFYILDLYGQIPFREVNEGVGVDPRVLNSQAAFEFIMKDLNDALPNLPELGPGNETIRASKAAGHFLIAKMLLNKHIYLKGDPQAADMTEVIQHIDAIKAQGFDLEAGYFDIFSPDVSSETIFWTNSSVGNKMWNGLHYTQGAPGNDGGGWNGFSTTAEFYAKFEGPQDSNAPGQGQEERRGFVPTVGHGYGFLVGQQYSMDGTPLNQRNGRPLVFTKEFKGLIGNGEAEGIRILKYHPSNGAFTEHLILFRYADAHLMKVEAIVRGGTSSETALDLYNELRNIRNATPASSVALMDVLDERGRELYIEGWRRNDQIRFGTFTTQWSMKDNTDPYKVLFPIPAQAVASNPNLIQNPGY